jgi:hypothetical protein
MQYPPNLLDIAHFQGAVFLLPYLQPVRVLTHPEFVELLWRELEFNTTQAVA